MMRYGIFNMRWVTASGGFVSGSGDTCTAILLSSVFCFIYQLPSDVSHLTERNSTKTGHMFGSQCDLKMHVRNLGYTLPLTIWGRKPRFSTTLQLMATLTAYSFRRTQYTIGKYVGNYKGSPTSSWNFINFGPQMTENWTAIFTHPPQIMHSTSLPGFADGDQQTELNQMLPNGRSRPTSRNNLG